MRIKDTFIQDIIYWARIAVERYEECNSAPREITNLEIALKKYDEVVSKTTYSIHDTYSTMYELPIVKGLTYKACEEFVQNDFGRYDIVEDDPDAI